MFKKEFNDVFDYTKLSISELVEKIGYSRYWDLPNMLKLVLRKLNGNLDGKEDKIPGKGLSENDFTTILKNAYDSSVIWISTNGANLISHITRADNPHSVTKAQVGLANADNTSDANKPISIAQALINDTKVDKITGKGLSENDFTTVLKNIYDSAVSWISTNGTNLVNHITRIDNPHNVTKAQVGLSNVDNTSDINKPISTATQTALDLKEDKANKGIVNGYASLDSLGKVPISQLSSVLLSDTFVVGAQADMLALVAETGDVAVRTDLSKTFILTASPASNLANWQELLTPQSPVSSVNGQIGTVTLTKADIGLANVDNTYDVNKPVSIAQAIINDIKVDKNVAVIASTKTKITYDSKGLITNGEDATTADINPSLDRRYVKDADVVDINNLSGVNTGDQTSIVGINGTKAQYNTSLTDGDFLFVGDIPIGSVIDLPNGTVSINSGYTTETAIRPINELPLLSGNIDNTADKLVLYDASTDSHVFVTPAIVNAPEIFRNNGALSGVAPPPFKVGIDYTNGTQYYVNASGNWMAFPPGTTVVLTDLPNGTVSINAGLGGTETAIRPITEQDTLAGTIDEVNDFTTIFDASTGKHVKTPLSSFIKDLYRDRGMPNTLMTLSGVASFSRTNFLSWTNKFFILGGGRGVGTLSTAGYYEISMPPVGTVIQGVGGVPNQTVTATGIDMRASAGSWSVLYYILNAGAATTITTNFRLAGWQSDFVVPDNWVMVGAYNADALTLKLGNGQILKQGTDSTGAIPPFDATIDFSVNSNPNTAGTTFNPNTPTNNNVLYVSTIDGSQWTYNGTAYVAAPMSNDWTTTGNSGTVQTANFIGTRDNVGLSFRTNNQIRQTISTTGNIGIGTTNPSNKLDVIGSTFISGSIGIGNQVPTSRLSITGGTNDIGFYNGTTLNSGKQAIIKAIDLGIGQGHLAFETYRGGFGGGERMRLTDQGNFGINTTTPTNKLHVSNAGYNPSSNDLASIKVEGGFGGGIVFAEGVNRASIFSASGNSLNFCTGGTVAGTPQRMTITPTGNVGIGLTVPVQKLEVGGNIRVTGTPNYTTTAAAIADAALLAGTMYTVTVAGAKQLYLK